MFLKRFTVARGEGVGERGSEGARGEGTGHGELCAPVDLGVWMRVVLLILSTGLIVVQDVVREQL